MVLELSVDNIAIIDNARISFEKGFTVLTGETGAGKSLLVGAINLALGGRGDSEMVRTGSNRGNVTLILDISGLPAMQEKCDEAGVPVEDGQLILCRDINTSGRSTVRLNSRPVSVSLAKEILTNLVDLHGQHDSQALLNPEKQIEFLDQWIGAPAHDLISKVAELKGTYDSLNRKLASLVSSRRNREQRIDMLRFQIEEIETTEPKLNESADLQLRIDRLKNAEKISLGVSAAMSALGEGENAVLDQLSRVLRELETVAQLDPQLNDLANGIRDSLYTIQESGRELAHYFDSMESDANALEAAAARLDSLKTLFRKYGEDEEQVLEYLESAKEELSTLTDSGSSEEELEAEIQKTHSLLVENCKALTELRTKKAGEFSQLVTAEVRELAMDKAELVGQITSKPIDVNGADILTLLFSANAGESMRPLHKVASGGEISRVMLAIKIAGAGKAGVPTLIFDEIDTGLSGRAAAVTGRKLKELSSYFQVIAISHLPQIAAMADTHFRIEKNTFGGRTATSVKELLGEERVEEVARMLAGEDIGASALANAKELLLQK